MFKCVSNNALRGIILLIGIVFAVVSASGQGNPYKIDGECYALFNKALSLSGTDSCLIYTSRLRATARERKDRLAETMGYLVELQHAIDAGMDDDQVDESADKFMSSARRAGFNQYAYYGYSVRVAAYLNQGRTSKALELTDQLNDLVSENGDVNGLYNSYICLARIYEASGSEQKQREYLQKALDLNVNDIELSKARIYYDISNSYKNQADSAAFYLAKMGDNLLTARDSALFFSRSAIIAGKQGEVKPFYKAYTSYAAVEKKIGPYPNRAVRTEMEVLRYMISEDYESALRNIKKLVSRDQRLEYQELIANRQEDFKKAYVLSTVRLHNLDSIAKIKSYNAIVELENDIKEVLADKEDAETAARLAQLEAKSRTNYLIISVLGFMLVFLILAVTATFLYRRAKRLAREHRLKKLQAEEEEKKRIAAEKASAMKTMFLHNMNHEIRTPLNAIVGFSQLLAMPSEIVSQEDKDKYLDYISNSSSILMMHIDDILNMSDVEAGNYSIKPENCRVNELCRLAIKSMEYRVRPGIELGVESEVDDDYTIFADSRRIQQVVINFLTNASKYTEKGSIKVEISLSENPGWMTFSVRDTGSGIPKEKRDDVFERFTKLDNLKEGTGLGLNISKTIAEKLKGHVRLDPDYNDGCRFQLIVPLKYE